MVTAGDVLVIDGSRGEGGGQILRTAVTLSALLNRPLRIENIRKRRRKPGLAAQHLTAVQAVARLCGARVTGDELGSTTLEFSPLTPPESGTYRFDVGAAREGGSSGATTLVLQSLVLPLAAAVGQSEVRVVGGTHMNWSPSYDYVAEIWLPLLRRLGVNAQLELRQPGWFPLGRGEIVARLEGRGRSLVGGLKHVEIVDPGPLLRIRGRALASNLPFHVCARMAARARDRLGVTGVPIEVTPVITEAACAGAGLFLIAERENCRSGFGAIGERGKPSEAVADEAIDRLLAYWSTGAAFDRHLADQMLLPLALADGASRFTTDALTLHLETNAWIIESFGLARIAWRHTERGIGSVAIEPFSKVADVHRVAAEREAPS
jgi:RNA 3'-terminal phosphate cyclase (ATP)